MAPLDADASDSDSDSHPAREASESIKLRMRLLDWLTGWLAGCWNFHLYGRQQQIGIMNVGSIIAAKPSCGSLKER